MVNGNTKTFSSETTVFPRIVSAEIILFWKWKIWKFSYSFHMAFVNICLQSFNVQDSAHFWRMEKLSATFNSSKKGRWSKWFSTSGALEAMKIWLVQKLNLKKICAKIKSYTKPLTYILNNSYLHKFDFMKLLHITKTGLNSNLIKKSFQKYWKSKSNRLISFSRHFHSILQVHSFNGRVRLYFFLYFKIFLLAYQIFFYLLYDKIW